MKEKEIVIKEIMKLRKNTIKLTDEYLRITGHLHDKESSKGSSIRLYRNIREKRQREEYQNFKFPMLVEALKEHTRLNMIAKMKTATVDTATVDTYSKATKKLARGKK